MGSSTPGNFSASWSIVGAARIGSGDDVLAGLPELSVSGLSDSDSRTLLLARMPGPMDARWASRPDRGP
jgi:hypothetical protein